MPNTWITDMKHYLDERGHIASLPGPVRRLADHLGAIVVAITARLPEKSGATGVRCRRRPGHRACIGEIFAETNHDMNIVWECIRCGDNGLIQGWQQTPWDSRRVGQLQ